MSDLTSPSGLTIDGVRVPQHVEADGHEAVASYVLEQQTAPSVPAPTPAPISHPETDGADS